MLPSQGRTLLSNKRRNLDHAYAFGELAWYLSRSACVRPMLAYAPKYANFAESDGLAHGAYGARIAMNIPSHDQLWLAASLLSAKVDTRQCVITLWKPNDLLEAVHGDKKDLPCTLTMQFFVRHNKLHLVVNMRSNDVWLGFPYDVFCFTAIQTIMAMTIGVEVGEYTHNVGSMHLYEKNHKAAEEAEALGLPVTVPTVPYSQQDTLANVQHFIALESMLRHNSLTREQFVERRMRDPLGALYQKGLEILGEKFLS